MEYYEKTFRKRLKELRKEQGISSDRLGEEIGVCGSAVRRLERGERIPKFTEIIKLCQYFNVSQDYLTGVTDY